MIKKIGKSIIGYINKWLPKFNWVLVQGSPNTASNAIEVANYIQNNYDLSVYFVVNKAKKDRPNNLLIPGVHLIYYNKTKWKNIKYYLTHLCSKYIFSTHGSIHEIYSNEQIDTNIWHGIPYKKLGILQGAPPRPSDITVGTSQLTKKVFSDSFGIPEKCVYISGYPRNDMLLRAKQNKSQLKNSVRTLIDFDKIAFWMPTYRKSNTLQEEDGIEVGNPFHIKNFDISLFNNILKKANTLCLIKPHPLAPEYDNYGGMRNVRMIDNKGIAELGMSLYELLGCSDLLISDVSSVIIDYMLLDKPIICLSTDFEEYRKTRGFYFDDIENWIPSSIIKSQSIFFQHLENILMNGDDPSKTKREILKKRFFEHHDASSTERLMKHIFNKEIINS